MEKTIYIFEEWSCESPRLMAYLHVNNQRGTETYDIQFDNDWLKDSNPILLDPSINTSWAGRQYSSDKKLFGLLCDSCPDRWGRQLIDKDELITSIEQKRSPKTLTEVDYLLRVCDEDRMGALRFKTNVDDDFVAKNNGNRLSTRELEAITRMYENGEYDNTSRSFTNELLSPGSSLGGARPKATIKTPEGQLWIAKFPSKHDNVDAGAWEFVVSELARKCQLNVAKSSLEKYSKYGSTFLAQRFDRNGNRRIHFASAMNLLGKRDGDTNTSYLELADFISANGSKPLQDLTELWKRIVFNMCISNNDDHLRNHGFLLDKDGWTLSPAYDLNPNPNAGALHTKVSENDATISKDLALSVANKFNIKDDEADKIFNNITKIIKNNWQNIAKRAGIKNHEIDQMRPAFKLCY